MTGSTENAPPEVSNKAFRDRVFQELDQKLLSTPWNSGASEAHGMLCGLACRGVTADTIRTRGWLFQLSDAEHIDIIEGLFGLACRDLDDESFIFELMLPPDDSPIADQAEGLSSWCQGFLQGIYHENPELPEETSDPVREALNDILEIGHFELAPGEPMENERALAELAEFLRVAAQLIYDELGPAPANGLRPSTNLN